MARSIDDDDGDELDNPHGEVGSSRSLDLSSVDPYALLGVGAVLALMDSEEDIARITAGALTEATSVPLGALVLRNQTDGEIRVLGRYHQAPLPSALAGEIKATLIGEAAQEIEVHKARFPEVAAIGLRRLLLARMVTTEDDFGVLVAGAKSDGPFLPEQLIAMDALASQAAVALHRLKLTQERETREAALRESETQIRLLLNSTGEGIYGVDLAGNCTFCNQACLRLMGYDDKNDLLGQNMHALIHHTYPDGTPYPVEKCQIYQAFREGKGVHVDDEILWRNDGTGFAAEYWSYPVHREDKRVGCVVTFVDITARKQAEAQLQKTREAAEAANRAKSEFLANMSHELRSPLNGILGYAQILKADATLGDQHREGVEIIQRSGEHLLTLINDILDLSKIEAGKLELMPTEFDLPDFLKNIADMTRLRAEQKRLAFIYEPLSPLPLGVRGDEKRLRQVLINLLGNAVKYTENGGVSFKVGYHEAPDGKTLLRFQVEDTGIGITPEKLEEIFLPFSQVRDSQRGQIEGTGLGLTISQRLVRLMDGELNVKSTPDESSRFWFDIDLPEIPEWMPPEESVERTVAGFVGDKRKILVVDDRRENRAVLVGFLAPLGFEIAEAEDGREGLEKAEAFKPDLILMDLVMPVMDGFEATRRIRQSPELKDVVVIALSASVFEHNQQQSLDAGCDDFIPKPVRMESLLEKLGTHLGLQWIYPEKTPAESTVDASAEVTAGGGVAPPPEEAKSLYELALRGDIHGIQGWIKRIEEMGDEFAPLLAQIQLFAQEYDMKQIRELIKPYAEGSE